jgi:chemotaxis signal transduction protein
MELDNSAAAEAGTASPAASQWVVFVCSGRRQAVELARITEILTPRTITRLPGATGAAAGLIGVRSRVITCYDLGVVLGDQAARSHPDYRILLADAGERLLGLIVDEVLAVIALPVERTASSELVIGSVDWDGVPVAALDMDQLLGRALDPDVS